MPSASASASASPSTGLEDPHASIGQPEAPPPVTVRYGKDSATLTPFTFCYGNGCADGMPPAASPHVGRPDQAEIDFPLADWSFEASFRSSGPCGRVQTVAVDRSRDGRLILTPAGHRGTYDVTLSGRGDGDLFTVFRWTTPSDGPLAQPEAYVGVLADYDGAVDGALHVATAAWPDDEIEDSEPCVGLTFTPPLPAL